MSLDAHNFEAAVLPCGFSCVPFTHQSSDHPPLSSTGSGPGRGSVPSPGAGSVRGWGGGGQSAAYLLTLLDVVVLPGVGTPDEHDFELLLVPAVDERGEVLNQLVVVQPETNTTL